jgi:hypothetical protein
MSNLHNHRQIKELQQDTIVLAECINAIATELEDEKPGEQPTTLEMVRGICSAISGKYELRLKHAKEAQNKIKKN